MTKRMTSIALLVAFSLLAIGAQAAAPENLVNMFTGYGGAAQRRYTISDAYASKPVSGVVKGDRVLALDVGKEYFWAGGVWTQVDGTPQGLGTGGTPQFARVGFGVAADSRIALSAYANNDYTTPMLALRQAGTGDAGIRFDLAGAVMSYALGIDHSVAGDPLVLSTAADSAQLGTGNLLSITSAGNATLTGTLQATRAGFGGAPDAAITGYFYVSDNLSTPIACLYQNSTGDAALRFNVGTTISYAVGIDNSVAGDPLVFSTAASGTAVLGTGNILSVDSAGGVTLKNGWMIFDTAGGLFARPPGGVGATDTTLAVP